MPKLRERYPLLVKVANEVCDLFEKNAITRHEAHVIQRICTDIFDSETLNQPVDVAGPC